MKSFSNLILLVFIGFLLAPACSSQKVATASKDTSFKAKEKSLLWTIQSKETDKISYLYGTIHMIGKQDYFMPEKVKTAFKASDKVAFEIDLEEAQNPMVAMSMMGKMMMKDGTTLKDLVSEEDYKKIKEELKKVPMLGMLGNMADKIKPMFLSSMMSEQMMGKEIVSYEMEFLNMAKSAEKSMFGLETLDFQMSMFDSIPYKDQAQMLVDGLDDDGTEGEKMLRQLVDLYKQEDVPALYSMIKEQSEGIGNFETLLLDTRNKNWIPIIAEEMKKQATFFAVGAGHLGGDMGVIALLRKEGFKVIAIKK